MSEETAVATPEESSGDIEKRLVKQLVREIRNCSGYERTPAQVIEYLEGNNVTSIIGACMKILDDRDLIQAMARKMKLNGQDRIPSSVDLDMGV